MSTRGFVALTDYEWYKYLASRRQLDEVNFWQPHGCRGFRALKSGEAFFFKLHAPRRAIVGFGFFHRYECLTARDAWDWFGEANGAPDFPSMLRRIESVRQQPTPATGDFLIGCILIAAPVFFTENEWVTPPADWAKTGIQQGKTYDLTYGEGNRILRECMDRATGGLHYWNIDADPQLVAENFKRYGAAIEIRPRLGQGLFSLAVRDAYKRACAVTRERSLPVLEAAHIKPYSQGGQHRIDNGILLRSDLHRLFDRGYVTVTPDYVFVVGDSLREEYENGRSYYGLHGSKILLPDHPEWRPRREFLEWHQQYVFKG